MFSTHELADADLGSLARGHGGVRAVATLRAGYRSKLLVILRALLDRVPGDLGPLSPLSEAWHLLVEAQQVDSAAVDDVFGLPEVHGWAVDTLRRVATTDNPGRQWPFVGQLHAVAAAAAIRSGVDFKATVPAVNGVVALPGLGIATLSSCDHAELTSISRRVSVRTSRETVQLPRSLSEDGPGWLAQRRIRCVHADKVLDLWLDDIQPYRFGDIRPAGRLTVAEAEGWRQRLDRAWRLLVTNHPDIADELSVGLSAVVPKGAANRFRLASASTADAFGTMEIAPVEDAATMASVLIHEFSHSKLNGVLTLVDLDVEDRDEKYYAPWRDDPRPLHGLLHGAYSFLAVTDFWQRERHGEPAWELEFAMRRGQVVPALQAIAASGLLTGAGRLFVAAMKVVADRWSDSEVPEPVQRLADRALTDHRATWRLRHLRPSQGHVRQAAQLRHDGRPWPGYQGDEPLLAPTLKPMVESRARTHLTQWSLTDPVAFAALTENTVADEVSGATAADLALVRGDRDRARMLYIRQIEVDPHDHSGWIGLGLAADVRGLLEFPELAQAVHVAKPGDLTELVAWLSGVR